MQRSSSATVFILNALHMLHKRVGMLSDPERGVAMRTVGTITRRVALWIIRVAILRSEFFIVPLIFLDENNFVMMSNGQG